MTVKRSRSGKRKTPARYGAAWDIGLEIGAALSPPLPPGRGVGARELERAASEGEAAIRQLGGAGAPSGFLKLPGRRASLQAILRSVRRWRRRGLRDVIQVGIGGSALGAECIFKALAHPEHNLLPERERRGPRLHFLDNVDPERLQGLLEVVDLKRCLIHVVSKSGGTVETAAGFQVVREALRSALPKSRRERAFRDHVVATTGASPLRDFCRENEIETIDFPDDIGGRFSALTASGLFAPALAGVDVATVVGGAQRMARRLAAASGSSNLAAVAGAIAYLLERERGIGSQVFFPYADSLEPLARWMVQLTAESLGKPDPRGTGRPTASGVGSTPIPARGTTDQHSQVQLFVEGPADKLVVFVGAARVRRSVSMPRALPESDPGAYLAGLPLETLLQAERAGTALALARAERPSIHWQLPEIHPHTLGQLLLAWEVQTAVHAALLGVNAYDQPGVEAGKIAAFALIGRDGYEEEGRRIEAVRPPEVWVGAP